ncbi:hypothetical protein OAX78_02330 [Planctomycetota bacterium]|nr:hypothetical protein [Planctomycetota bacterium]
MRAAEHNQAIDAEKPRVGERWSATLIEHPTLHEREQLRHVGEVEISWASSDGAVFEAWHRAARRRGRARVVIGKWALIKRVA